MDLTLTRARQRATLLFVLVVALAIAAGCGGSDDGGSAGGSSSTSGQAGADSTVAADSSGATDSTVAADSTVVAAEEAVAEASAPIETFPGPTEAVEAVPGKKIFIVSCGSASEGCKTMADGMAEAAAALGWESTILNPLGTPDEINAAMQRAIDTGADAILWVGYPRVILQEILQRAENEGVEMVSVQTNEDDPNDVSMDAREEGRILADYIIADSNGTAKVLMLTDKEFPTLTQIDEGFEERMKECSGCEILGSADVTVATITKDAVPKTVNLLKKYPDATYIYAVYDSLGRLAVTGVKQAQKQDSVKVVSESGELPTLDMIRNGDVFAATVSIPHRWLGWSAVDIANRLFAGAPAVEHPMEMRLLTNENLPPEGERYESEFDVAEEYQALWGLP